MQTERVTFLASPEAKRTITARATARGMSVGEYVRRKALDEDEASPEEEAELAMLIEQVNAAAPRIQASLDRISENVRRLCDENDTFFRARGIRS